MNTEHLLFNLLCCLYINEFCLFDLKKRAIYGHIIPCSKVIYTEKILRPITIKL